MDTRASEHDGDRRSLGLTESFSPRPRKRKPVAAAPSDSGGRNQGTCTYPRAARLDRYTLNMNPLSLATTLLREGKLAWHLFRDPRVPTLAKFIPAFALLYVLSPIDLIPDWVPIIGGVD